MMRNKLSKEEITKKVFKALNPEMHYNQDIVLINALQEALKGEFQQWDLYYTYMPQIKGPAREDVIEEFEEHAEEEAKHILTVERFLVEMGAQPTTDRKPIERVEPTLMNILNLQLKFEQEAVDTYTRILPLLEGNPKYSALRIEIENILINEKEHVQDIKLFMGQ